MRTQIAAVVSIVMLIYTTTLTAQTQFIIGTEDINFYPHYNFTRADSTGFANDVLQLFAREYGYQFSFQPLPVNKNILLQHFRTLAVIHGFTPTAWLNLRNQYRFKLYEVPNAISAVNLVLKGELQGADVEYNVAQHILRTQQQEGALVVAEQLPVTRISFHLSTIRHPQVIQQFNRFLLSHQADIEALKHKYQLTDSLPQ